MARQTRLASFEKNLNELEALVEHMERGELPLEESLRQFERGMRLIESCQKALDEAEQKVEVLVKKDGETSTRPFEEKDSGISGT